jgi:hypothetical protein
VFGRKRNQPGINVRRFGDQCGAIMVAASDEWPTISSERSGDSHNCSERIGKDYVPRSNLEVPRIYAKHYAPRRAKESMVQMKSEPGPPMTLGNAAAARARLIVWCKDCRHQIEPDPSEMAQRYGAATTVPDWRERLICSRCGSRHIDMVVTGERR